MGQGLRLRFDDEVARTRRRTKALDVKAGLLSLCRRRHGEWDKARQREQNPAWPLQHVLTSYPDCCYFCPLAARSAASGRPRFGVHRRPSSSAGRQREGQRREQRPQRLAAGIDSAGSLAAPAVPPAVLPHSPPPRASARLAAAVGAGRRFLEQHWLLAQSVLSPQLAVHAADALPAGGTVLR